VVFEYGGETKKTGIVWNNDTIPEWLEEIEFEVSTHSLQFGRPSDRVLRIAVRDFDRYGPDEALGHVDEAGLGGIDLLDLLQPSVSPETARPLQFGVGGSGDGRSTIRWSEAAEDGSVRCGSGRLVLRGEGCGDRGASLEFEALFLPSACSGTAGAGGGGPLVVQPEAEDGALRLMGEVGCKMRSFKDEFERESLGFFLGTEDASSASSSGGVSSRSTQRRPSEASLAAAHSDAVVRYNRLLDQLNVASANWGRAEASSGGGGGLCGAERDQFEELLRCIQDIELKAKHDSVRRAAYACQDELLPSVGEWSTDRRRKLRNQVFLARLRLASTPSRSHGPSLQLPSSPASQSPCNANAPPACAAEFMGSQGSASIPLVAVAIFAGVLVYLVAVSALIWGQALPHRGEVMLVGSGLALACLGVAACCARSGCGGTAAAAAEVPTALSFLHWLATLWPKGSYNYDLLHENAGLGQSFKPGGRIVGDSDSRTAYLP